MGGPGAPDDLDAAHRTQVWLAVSEAPAATVTGEYFYHMRRSTPNPVTRDAERQERLLDACKRFSGVDLPTNGWRPNLCGSPTGRIQRLEF
jgi:hypothetical protein